MPIDMPIWIGEISQEPTPRGRATDNQWLLRKGKSVFSRDKLINRLINPTRQPQSCLSCLQKSSHNTKCAQ